MKTDPHDVQAKNDDGLAADLTALGYPGLSYLKSGRKRDPAEVVLSALRADNLDVRLIEALPCMLLHYPDLNWDWLVRSAKKNELQNKLGFVTKSICRGKALEP